MLEDQATPGSGDSPAERGAAESVAGEPGAAERVPAGSASTPASVSRPWAWSERIAQLEAEAFDVLPSALGRGESASTAGAGPRRRAVSRRRRSLGLVAACVLAGGLLTAGLVLDRDINGQTKPGRTRTSTSGPTELITSPEALPLASSTVTDLSGTLPRSSTPAASAEATPYSLDAGSVILSDDFASGPANWPIGEQAALTKLSAPPGRYVIAASGTSTDHLIDAPVKTGHRGLAVTVIAAQASGQGTAGFGVICRDGTSDTVYEFIVLNNGGWLVERREGPPSRTTPPTILAHGTSGSVPGAALISVTGICAASDAGASTRLVLIVAGTQLTDFTDAFATPAGGWRGGIVVSTVDAAATVVVRHVEERDLD